jgi:hypothetical protein
VRRVVGAGAALAGFLGLLAPSTALACSPPFDPSIEALGPDQVVVVGTIGEPMPGGRHFRVSRWFNGPDPRADLLIAFKEGDPVGDCSYHPTIGEPMLIAPYLEGNGRLSADVATLQAPIGSDEATRYVAEAERLFGPGTVMHPAEVPAEDSSLPWFVSVGAVVLAVLGGAWLGMTVRGRRRPSA